MSLPGRVVVPEDSRAYPGRHQVQDALLLEGAREIPVVVKRTRLGWRQRLGTPKGERSYRTALELRARGLPTPEPLGFEVRDGDSWFVARRLEGARQLREWLLFRDGAGPAPALPIAFETVLGEVALLARALHDGGVFFRDLSDGNVLLTREEGPPGFRLWLVDLNRARVSSRPVGLWNRLRDLSRPGINREDDHKALLSSYFAPAEPPGLALATVRLMRRRRVLWDRLKRALRPWKRR